MKRKRKVILIACSLVLVALFIAIAWLKANGEFLALDRSGMTLSPGETARWLFSDDVENGVMFVWAEFPKKPDSSSISESKAWEIVRRSSPKSKLIFWQDIDGVGPVGLFADWELGEITIYREAEVFAFELLANSGRDLKTQFPTESIKYPITQIMVLPQGLDLARWEFRKVVKLEDLRRFSSCRLPDSHNLYTDVAFYSGREYRGPDGEDDDIIIYFDSSSKSWRVKKWNEKWLLWKWKAFVMQGDENEIDN